MIKLVKSTYYQEEKTTQDLVSFLQSAKQLSLSKYCHQFEEEFSQYQERSHTVFVNSGSSANLALILALLNLGWLQKGDKVGFSALTWSTNVMPLIQLGLEAVPIDVELDTLNVSSKQLKKVLKKHDLRAFFITNLLGFCDDLDQIAEICDQQNIMLLEDNCESLGSVYKGKKLGNFGLASTFSFYVGHHMSTIEGGAVCTDNQELADMLNIVRAHGWDRNMKPSRQDTLRNLHKVNSSFYSRYTFYDLGFNLRPTEISGFLGVNQLQYVPEIVQKRQDNFLKLAKLYELSDLFYPLRFDHMDVVSNFAVPLVCRTTKIRNKYVKSCDGLVEIRPIVGGDMTYQPFFTKHMPEYAKRRHKSNARLAHEQGLYFGNNPELTPAELKKLWKVFSA